MGVQCPTQITHNLPEEGLTSLAGNALLDLPQ